MKSVESVPQRGWEASLELSFRREGGRSILAKRSSYGPLAIQKALYPEGENVCHAILLHPPGGIAGGDRLAIDLDLGCDARALLTTPGATKWYRTAGAQASQHVRIAIRRNAVCEWMPQENIFFNAAQAENSISVELEDGAAFCGWDIMCLGRMARGERFSSGRIRQHLRIAKAETPLFEEIGTIEGGSALLDSPVALAGYPVCGTFIVAGIGVGGDTLESCRNTLPQGDCKWGISAMGEVTVARCLARSGEAVRQYFLALWDHLRPRYALAPVQVPRIWAT
ncbi:MAG TPA: urease accessory protein UreD [Burkholderiales bacterium]|nr:urease accessory protein UreD [Burkholderiales bacterium]